MCILFLLFTYIYFFIFTYIYFLFTYISDFLIDIFSSAGVIIMIICYVIIFKCAIVLCKMFDNESKLIYILR